MLNQNLLLTGDDGYNLTNSLRFRSSASAYLNRTFGTPTDNKKFTWSGWVKRGTLGAYQVLQCGDDGTSDNFLSLRFSDTDTLQCFQIGGGSYNLQVSTSAVFRDPSAWYHIVFIYDSANATSTNRIQFYVNGVLQAVSYAVGPFAQNTASQLNVASRPNAIGRLLYASVQYFDGYMAETHFIDGQALTPSSFGSTNALTGVWQPAKYTGTYGTNGFYLPFTDNSALTTSSNVGLGKDFSGNGNYWTTNNISITAGSTYDSMTDVPTLTSATTANYAVFNPVNVSGGGTTTITDGNLAASAGSTTTFAKILGSIGMSSGKWYWEVTVTAVGSLAVVGIGDGTPPNGSTSLGGVAGEVSYLSNGNKYTNAVSSAYGSSYTTNDVIGVAYDADAGSITFYKNNTSQGAITGFSGTKYAGVSAGGGTNPQYAINFGQQPFSYTPPTGFVALNTFNLSAPTINNGAAYMAATIWNGDGTTSRSISTAVNGVSFQPDFVWVKARNNAREHILEDSVRGLSYNNQLSSNSTGAESSNPSAGGVTGANSTTITLGGTGAMDNVNRSTWTYVAWQWKAGGTAVTNTAGSITSQVSANTTSGFSVVTYTGTGVTATIGHGLGVAPSMVIVKLRSSSGENWNTWHTSLNNTAARILLNTTAAVDTGSPTIWGTGGINPTSTTFQIGTNSGTNGSSSTYVAYCFAPIAGYSAFGSYTGNGSADGTFVYTGFRPRYVMFKRTDSISNWTVRDTARRDYNSNPLGLFPNLSAAEDSTSGREVDMLSNGFKIRGTDSDLNTSGGTYTYMAFAENPFRNSLAR